MLWLMRLFAIFQGSSSFCIWMILPFFLPTTWRNTRNMSGWSYRGWKIKLSMKVEKCEFHVSRVSFQGFIIEQWKVKSDPATVQGYSRIAAPLCQLTSTSTLFSWTPEAEAAISQVETPFHMCVCPLASRSFPVSLLCRWMHLTQEWGLFLSGTLRIRNYTPAPAIPHASLRQSAITT